MRRGAWPWLALALALTQALAVALSLALAALAALPSMARAQDNAAQDEVPAASAAEPHPLLRAQAARGSWNDAAPPQAGWEDVSLPDHWPSRWPGFDGVVWYRLSWDAPAPLQPAGLLVHYLNMAGEIRVNGTELWRDLSLVEPLTRAWNQPRHFLLAPPLLREGRNELLVRVSGLSAYQPGLGPVTVGAPGPVQAMYEHERLVRRELQILALAVSSVMAFFFAAVWLMRPAESAHGWFALMSLLWLLQSSNQLVTSPWPFATTDAWQALNTMLLAAFSAAYTVFVLRFCERRMPRAEAALAGFVLVACAGLALAGPAGMALQRGLWTTASVLIVVVACAGFLAHALRHRQPAHLVLAPFMAAVVVAGSHDLLVFMRALDSNIYYSGSVSYMLLLGMALVLAWRFASDRRQIETFNAELLTQIDAAKAELTATLEREHGLQMAHARMRERSSIASDLHDGLGGMLVGSIATLEQSPHALPQEQLLGLLRGLRDDLRLIIDAAGQQDGLQVLGEVLAPLRHRITQIFEANGIRCAWRMSNLDTLVLDASINLGVMRFLQEALTNVLKHSGARQVEVSVRRQDGELLLCVRDDGRGFVDADLARPGATGMRSMRTRAARMGGAIDWRSAPGETRVTLRLDLLTPA